MRATESRSLSNLHIPIVAEVLTVLAYVFSHATNATPGERVEALVVSGLGTLLVVLVQGLRWSAASWWTRGYDLALVGVGMFSTGVAVTRLAVAR